MIIRSIEPSDLPRVRELHEKFYKNEFDFPEFKNTLCAFVVTNNDQIVCMADVHVILEVTLVTNKEISQFGRKRALFQVLDMCKFIAKRHGFDQIHAFVQESIWKRALKKFGFANTKGNALFINVG